MAVDDLWFAMPVLTGRLVRLEPLTLEHARGYHAAAGDPPDAEEVFRWLNPAGGGASAPQTLADAVAHIVGALGQRARGERLPYAQIEVSTGQFIGTTSLYEVVPGQRTLAIGHTWIGKRWWRTGVNTEAKLLLLTYAFDALGAVRVVWHTDLRNVRSQEAIARLGAIKEGVLRKHKLRRDGTWRDTVIFSMTDEEWPAARDALAARLTAG